MNSPNDSEQSAEHAAASVPAGAWAVGVSGGADSVALLALLRERADLTLRVVHLDHETRGEESAEDAAFVARLAAGWGLPVTIARRSDVESGDVSANPSARYRRARFALFRREVLAHGLRGVVLAHHADDQAETVVQRLVRGSGAIGLGGIKPRSRVDGVAVLHPLLGVRRSMLRDVLIRRGLTWREDASNASPRYARNRVRQVLARFPAIADAALELGAAAVNLREALDAFSPHFPERFAVAALREVALTFARHAARRWLIERGAAATGLNGQSVERLVAMACDAASPPRQHVPGGLLVRRRGGEIFVDPSFGA